MQINVLDAPRNTFNPHWGDQKNGRGESKRMGEKRRERIPCQWHGELPPIGKWLMNSFLCVCTRVHVCICGCVSVSVPSVCRFKLAHYCSGDPHEARSYEFNTEEKSSGAWLVRLELQAASSGNPDLCLLSFTSVRRHIFLVNSNLGQGFPL